MLHSDRNGLPSDEPERFVQAALDSLSAHIAILDEDGNIIGVNAAWCQFADGNKLQTNAYAIGSNYLSICDQSNGKDSEEAGSAARGIREVIAQQRDEFTLEYPCHGQGVQRWFLMHVTRFEYQGRKRFIVAHQNVTEVKEVQVELEESRKHIQAILDSVINGIVTLDQYCVIESANPAAIEIFGYDRAAELLGKNINDIIQTDDQPLNCDDLTDMQGPVDYEIEGVYSDGSHFPVTFAVTRVSIDNKVMYICIVQDITERKRMEQELLEKERLHIELEKERELRDLKNRFITMMSHELRTPLASIMLSGDMLRIYGKQSSEDEKLLYLNNIRTQVDQLTELIQDVLTISRVDTQKSMFMPELLEMVNYCRDIIEEFNMNYRQTHELIFSSEANSIYTLADPKLIRRILNNLLSNAIKYSPQGGAINVGLTQQGHNMAIEVRDHGIGIPASDIARLSEPFHRAANVDQVPGTGLGLAITRQAIELHQGTLDIESQEGQGTLVRVRLPLKIG